MKPSKIAIDILLTIINATQIQYPALETAITKLGYKKSEYKLCLTQFKQENYIRTKKVASDKKNAKPVEVCEITKNGTVFLAGLRDTPDFKDSKANV